MATVTGSLDNYSSIHTHDFKATAVVETAIATAFKDITASLEAGTAPALTVSNAAHTYTIIGGAVVNLLLSFSRFVFTDNTTNISVDISGDFHHTYIPGITVSTQGSISSLIVTGPEGSVSLNSSTATGAAPISFIQSTVVLIDTVATAWGGTIDSVVMLDGGGANSVVFSDLLMDINTYIAASDPAKFLDTVSPSLDNLTPIDPTDPVTPSEPDDAANTSGNDVFTGGLEGINNFNYDTAFAGHTISVSPEGVVTISNSTDGTDLLTNVERAHFADTSVAFDINGNAGEAYRIYKAAFDREPDLGGLGFWIDQLDNGASALEMASGFTGSAEFLSLYGNNTSNFEYLDLLYNNILDRSGDESGAAFWLGHLDSGAVSREQILIDFSGSTENQANVIELISGGIEYTLFGG